MASTLRLAVLGDSLSAGVGDPDPAHGLLAGIRGRLLGWPTHLARALATIGVDTDLLVLARNGARTAAVRAEQLDAALDFAPDVATCFTGVNDVFAPTFDPEQFGTDYREVVGSLAATVTRGVVTLALHDVAAPLPMRGHARLRLRANVRAANDVLVDVARDTGAWLLDEDRLLPDLYGAGLLAVDRLHPNTHGHARIAHEVARELQLRGAVPDAPLPDPIAPVSGQRVALGAVRPALAHLGWMLRFAPGPLARGRSLPDLIRPRPAPTSPDRG